MAEPNEPDVLAPYEIPELPVTMDNALRELGILRWRYNALCALLLEAEREGIRYYDGHTFVDEARARLRAIREG
jgi:hypothetical protein